MNTINFILGFLVIIAIGIGLWVLIIRLSREKEEYKDNTLALNFMSHYSGGRAIGMEMETIVGKGGRKIITMSPRDVDSQKIKDLKDEKVIVQPNNLISLPKGTWSKDKNIHILLPKNAEDFPQPLKETEFGKMLAFYTELKNADRTELGALREGLKRQSAHIEAMGSGEVSKKRMLYMRGLFDDTLSAVLKEQKGNKGTSGGTSYPTPQSYGGN